MHIMVNMVDAVDVADVADVVSMGNSGNSDNSDEGGRTLGGSQIGTTCVNIVEDADGTPKRHRKDTEKTHMQHSEFWGARRRPPPPPPQQQQPSSAAIKQSAWCV